MAFPYALRHAGGFVDLPLQTTPIDAQFLNAVEQALIALMNDTPAASEVPVYDTGTGKFVAQKLTNAEIAATAAIARSKLDFGSGLVNADIAAAAAIAYSKLALSGSIVNADIASAAAIALSKLAGYPSNSSKFARGDGTWAAVTLTTAEADLGADVPMTNANQFYDGPSVSLAAGTWLVVGVVTVTQGGTGAKVTAKLWDGITVESSSSGGTFSANPAALPLAGIVSPGSTTTYKISAAADATTHTIKAAAPANGAGNNASHIRAIEVA